MDREDEMNLHLLHTDTSWLNLVKFFIVSAKGYLMGESFHSVKGFETHINQYIFNYTKVSKSFK